MTLYPQLAVSRSFGDFIFKQNDRLGISEQAMTAIPEIDVYSRNTGDAFLVLASDGIFDFMSNQEVVDFIGSTLGYTRFGAPVAGTSVEELAEACDKLVYHCLDKGSSQRLSDNLCVVVVILGSSGAIAASNHPSQTPLQTPRHPVLTPSSGTANATPVAQTLTRVFEVNTLDTSLDTAQTVEGVSRVLAFD